MNAHVPHLTGQTAMKYVAVREKFPPPLLPPFNSPANSSPPPHVGVLERDSQQKFIISVRERLMQTSADVYVYFCIGLRRLVSQAGFRTTNQRLNT